METDKADLNIPSKSRSATASWSGYNYQGKVGIYVALKKIKELIAEDSAALNNLNDFLIEYESPTGEDFDIKENKNILSRHQVKAINSDSLSSYRDVLEKVDGFNITGVDEDKRYLHVSKKVEGWGLSKEEFTKQYPSPKKWVDNLNKIKLYSYDGNDFCSIGEIANKCCELLCKIFQALNSSGTAPLEQVESEDRFHRIQEELGKKITGTHSRMQSHNEPNSTFNINFNEIIQIINGEDEISVNRSYVKDCRRLKNKFTTSCEQAIQDFILDNEESLNEYQASIITFQNIYNRIIQKPNEEFMDLINHISFRYRENTMIDFEEAAIKQVIAEYIIKTNSDQLDTEKFLFDKLLIEKHILSGICAENSLKPSLKTRIQKFLMHGNSIRSWSSDEFIVNQNITHDWKWDEELISKTTQNSEQSEQYANRDEQYCFTRPDSIKLRSVDDAIKRKRQENE